MSDLEGQRSDAFFANSTAALFLLSFHAWAIVTWLTIESFYQSIWFPGNVFVAFGICYAVAFCMALPFVWGTEALLTVIVRKCEEIDRSGGL